MPIYKKQCPKCNADMVYEGKNATYHLQDSIKKNRHCHHCCQLGKVLSAETRRLIGQNNHMRGKPSVARKKPYEWLHHRMEVQATARGIANKLPYEQFIQLMNQPCDYCGASLTQSPYHHNKTKNFGWSLDRKDNTGPYSADNCVSCCFRCNRIKGKEFNYEQMKQIGNIIRGFQCKLNYKYRTLHIKEHIGQNTENNAETI